MIQFKAVGADKSSDACPVLAVSGGKLDAVGRELDERVGGVLAASLKAGDLPARCGSAQLVRTGPDAASRAILVSAGDAAGLSDKAYQDLVRSALRLAMAGGIKRIASHLHTLDVSNRDTAWKVEQLVLLARDLCYRMDEYRSQPKADPSALSRIDFVVDVAGRKAVDAAAEAAVAIADAIDFCRTLGNTPPNVCNPRWLADQARKMAGKRKLAFEALDQKQMKALGMGALLAVAQGSEEPPRLICVQYKGAGAKQQPIVLVGKGVTFDTGGISIKPAPDMDEMKFDMCGAATVLAAVQAAADLKLPLNVVAVVPSVENMPSGGATRPGDIVTTMSGQTVEILNTDAEGRLILCDALTWAQKEFKPAALIDVATLTGAMIIALGSHYTGLFSTDDALAARLLEAGRASADPCWRMPVEEAYQDALRSTFADMGNIGGRAAGSVTAACFLSRFARDVPWAHLDIAGVAWKGGTAKAANGRPVGLLVQYLRSLAA